MGTYVSIYKTDRNKLMEMFTFENITAGALLDSIFYYGHDNILDEVCFVKYSSLSVFCDFFKNNNLQYEYEDTIELTKDIYESIIKWLKKELESYSLLDIANNIVGEDKALSMINVYSVLTNLSFDWKMIFYFYIWLKRRRI